MIILPVLFSSRFLPAQDMELARKMQDTFLIAKDDTSRINALRKLGKVYDGVKPDSAIYFTKQALILAEKINWVKGVAQNSLNLGAYLANISMYDSAIYFDNKALKAAELVGDKSRIALIYNNRSNIYTETQQYEKAMADIKVSMRISEETGNKDRMARAYQSMCEIYMYQENYDAAKPWAEKALQLEKELGNEELQSAAEMSLGGMYSLKNDFKKAEAYLLDAVQKANKTNRPDITIECYISLSDGYIQRRKYEKAIAVLQQGIALANSFQLFDPLASLYQNLGNTWYAMAKYKEALAAHQKGYEAIKGKKEFQKNQYYNLEGMAQSYAALGEFRNAYESGRLASEIKDSALQKQGNEKLLKLQTEFETIRKEKQIELLKKDQELHNIELQKERTIKVAAFILSGLLLLIGFLMVNRYRMINKTKRIVEIEKLRNNIARDLHDDIGSALSSININSKMALSNTAEEKLVKGQLEKIKEHSGRMMEGMSDIVWAINPVNDSLEKMMLRMKEFAVEMLESLNINFTFNNTIDPAHTTLDVGSRKEVYLIFKEAINNAAKYSDCSNILIDIEANRQNIRIRIMDDGKGFDKNIVKCGNGLRNMEQRATAIGAAIHIFSTPGKGTTVSLDIPVS